jgi:hypothetical protein
MMVVSRHVLNGFILEKKISRTRFAFLFLCFFDFFDFFLSLMLFVVFLGCQKYVYSSIICIVSIPPLQYKYIGINTAPVTR